MPCYHPLRATKRHDPHTGKNRVRILRKDDPWPDQSLVGSSSERMFLPCGQCIGCRLERSRKWAIRCIHEAQMHEDNCFITLTFDGENVTNSLVKADFQKFMKRLRKCFDDRTIRYFHCGEYGSLLQRPHHHACLFGVDFPDKTLFSQRQGVRLYVSGTLQKLWPYGYSTVGEVTFESAAYVARYILKKQTGEKAPAHYAGRLPEYTTMSRRPGLGSAWFNKFGSDVFPSDEIILPGRGPCKPPKYYDRIFDRIDPVRMEAVKRKRLEEQENPDLQRLKAGEVIKKQQIGMLPREVE